MGEGEIEGGWCTSRRGYVVGGVGVTVAPLSLRSPTMFMWFPATAMYMVVKPN